LVDPPKELTVSIPANGVRGIDGAGIDQYSPTAALTSRSTTFSAELAETATLNLSINTSSPKKNDVVVTAGASEDEMDKLALLVIDLKAEKDDVKITDMGIDIDKSGSGGANASTTVYLFEGSTELDSASLVGSGASGSFFNFTDFNYVVPKGTTKTLTVKADIRSANGTIANFTANASTTGTSAMVSENTKGDSVTESGSATGYQIGIRNVGPEFTLVSKSIVTNDAPQKSGTTTNVSTSTLTVTFNVKVKALGGAIEFGTNQSTTSPFVASTTGFGIYRNGVVVTNVGSVSTSTSITIPSTCTTSGFTNSCSLAEGAEVTVPVTFRIEGRDSTGGVLTTGLYSIDIARINWTNPTAGTVNNSTFMSGEVDWRTADVSFP
ncbi:MAG: hypothetical protein AAB861_04285, partial [Patescibacteria group bacterium]